MTKNKQGSYNKITRSFDDCLAKGGQPALKAICERITVGFIQQEENGGMETRVVKAVELATATAVVCSVRGCENRLNRDRAELLQRHGLNLTCVHCQEKIEAGASHFFQGGEIVLART